MNLANFEEESVIKLLLGLSVHDDGTQSTVSRAVVFMDKTCVLLRLRQGGCVCSRFGGQTKLHDGLSQLLS